MKLDPVFVITRDGDVYLHKTIEEAEGAMEGYDVADGEYVDFFRIDGELLALEASAGQVWERVTLRATGRHDRVRLVERLRELAERNEFEGDDPDPRDVANEVFAKEWAARWPRWPGWLDRRLHGQGPPHV